MNVPEERRRFLFSVDGRYSGQVWQIPVSLDFSDKIELDDLNAAVAKFHEEHNRLYAVSSPSELVEFLEWRLQAVGIVAGSGGAEVNAGVWDKPPCEPVQREIYGGSGASKTMVPAYRAGDLTAGQNIVGPALIESQLTSNFLPVGCSAVVTLEGGLLISLPGNDQAEEAA